jgi:hypothetical protein
MLMRGLKMVLGLALVAGVIAVAMALENYRARAEEKPAKEAPPRGTEEQKGEKLKALLQERQVFAKQQFNFWRENASTSLKDLKDLESIEKSEKEGPRRLFPSPAERDRITKLHASRSRVPDEQSHLYQWAYRLLQADLDLCNNKAKRVSAYEAHLQRMKEMEDEFKKGVVENKGVPDLTESKFHRLEAEILLERAKAN